MSKHWAKSVDGETPNTEENCALKERSLRRAYRLNPCVKMEYNSGKSVRHPYGMKMYAELIRKWLKPKSVKSVEFEKAINNSTQLLIQAEKPEKRSSEHGVSLVIMQDISFISKGIKSESMPAEGLLIAKIKHLLSTLISSAIMELGLKTMKRYSNGKEANVKYVVNTKETSKEDLMLIIATGLKRFADCSAFGAIAA